MIAFVQNNNLRIQIFLTYGELLDLLENYKGNIDLLKGQNR